MRFRQYTLATAVMAVAISIALPFQSALAQSEEARVSRAELLEGDWRGPDGNGYLTFRFQYEDGTWLGFFVSERDGSLYPVEDVRVSGRTVSFRQRSTPELLFKLAVEDDDRTLSGTATLPNGMVLTYSLERK